jgi:hypothetical protein
MGTIIELIIFSALAIWFVYRLVDFSGPRQFRHGVVVGKKFTKGYWLVYSQPTSITTASSVWTRMPDSYVLRIHIADDIANKSVSKELYENIQEGETISVEYSQGRLSKDKVFIKKAWK